MSDGRIEHPGQEAKVERTLDYFREVRASLRNGLDAVRDAEAENVRLRDALAAAESALEIVTAENERLREEQQP